MYQQRFGARAEHRKKEAQRVRDSVSLAAKFPDLKSLTVELRFFDSAGVSKLSEVKYSVNLANARSVFCFHCPNNECVEGDFDLTKELATAVAARHKAVSGELKCQGWRSRTTINQTHCHNLLRYKLILGY